MGDQRIKKEDEILQYEISGGSEDLKQRKHTRRTDPKYVDLYRGGESNNYVRLKEIDDFDQFWVAIAALEGKMLDEVLAHPKDLQIAKELNLVRDVMRDSRRGEESFARYKLFSISGNPHVDFEFFFEEFKIQFAELKMSIGAVDDEISAYFEPDSQRLNMTRDELLRNKVNNIPGLLKQKDKLQRKMNNLLIDQIEQGKVENESIKKTIKKDILEKGKDVGIAEHQLEQLGTIIEAKYYFLDDGVKHLKTPSRVVLPGNSSVRHTNSLEKEIDNNQRQKIKARERQKGERKESNKGKKQLKFGTPTTSGGTSGGTSDKRLRM